MEKQLTRKQVAERLHVSEMTVDRWIKSGYLWASHFGPRQIRIPLSEIEKIEKAQKPPQD